MAADKPHPLLQTSLHSVKLAISKQNFLFGFEFKNSMYPIVISNLLKYAKKIWSNSPVPRNIQLQNFPK